MANARTKLQRHDFGPNRIGTVYIGSGRVRSAMYPARDVLHLPVRVSLEIDAGRLTAAVPGSALPHSLDALIFGTGVTAAEVSAILSGARNRSVQHLDLSRVAADDPRTLSLVRLKGLRSWTPPAWLPAHEVARVGTEIGTHKVAPAIELYAPPWTGDPNVLHQLVQSSRADHPDVVPPHDVDAAVRLADTYTDSRQFGRALAVLSGGLAAQSGSAYYAAATACLGLEDLPAALAAYASAEATGTPTLAVTRAHRADALRESGRRRPGLMVIDDALSDSPNYGFALVVKGFALVEDNQVEGAERIHARLTEVMPGQRDELVLGALIVAARSNLSVSNGLFAVIGRPSARRAVTAWQRVLTDYPNDVTALARLAQAQRIARPWSHDWADTHLIASDEAGPRSASGRNLATLAVAHPTRISLATTAIVTGAWFLLAVVGALPHIVLGYPLLAGAAVGPTAFILLWRRIPGRARRAAARLGHTPRTATIVFAVLGVAAVVSIIFGQPIVQPGDQCDSRGGGGPDCPPSTVYHFTPPSIAPFTFSTPTLPRFSFGPAPSLHVPGPITVVPKTPIPKTPIR